MEGGEINDEQCFPIAFSSHPLTPAYYPTPLSLPLPHRHPSTPLPTPTPQPSTPRQFLKHHGLSCSHQVDLDLEARSRTIWESRKQWQGRLFSIGTSSFDPDNPKCTYKWCANFQTPADPFDIQCRACHEAHYCSGSCAYMDSGFHSRACRPKPHGKLQRPQPGRYARKLSRDA